MLTVLVLAACAGEAPDTGVVVRDSAGIAIIENTAPRWAEGEGWRVGPEPSLTIGVLEGAEEYQLFRARSAVRLDDGRIVVANGGSSELRFYDGDGRFLQSVGGEGGGPGEFGSFMGAIWRAAGDSLVVYDYTNGMRLSVFDREGTFGRMFRLDAASGSLPLAHDLIWGTTVISRSGIYGAGNAADGLRRDSMLYCTHTMDGAMRDTLGRFPGSEMFARSMGQSSTLAMSRPFGREAHSAATADAWYFGSSDQYEIQGYGHSGALERLIRRDVTNRPVTAEQRQEYEVRASGVRSEIPIPETMPAHGRLLGDADGNLWVQDYRVADEPERWAVFDATGRFLGTVEMPQPGRVTEIGSDYVLGIWTDDFDVEQVRLYALTKNE